MNGSRRRAAAERLMFNWLKTLIAKEKTYPPAPPGTVLYGIGDIHGRADCLDRVHALIDRDIAARPGGAALEIYVGDYVDRGPDSKGVVDRLIARAAARDVALLKGNHEIIMESFLRGKTNFEDWRPIGGLETALSYGVNARELLTGGGTIRPRDLAERLPVAHLRFLDQLQDMVRMGPYCFVHAGIRPGVPLSRQSIEDLTGIRDEFLDYTGEFGCIVVHGHTPVGAIDFLANRINIDTGAYATNRLSVIRIDESGVSALEETV